VDPGPFLVAGAHRNVEDSDGDSNTHLADVAHSDGTYFHHAHLQLARSDSITLQPHGFSRSGYPDLVISGGEAIPPGPTQIWLDAIVNAAAAEGFSSGQYDGNQYTDLGATTNIQGQFSRSLGGIFLHVEAQTIVRTDDSNRIPLGMALGDLWRPELGIRGGGVQVSTQTVSLNWSVSATGLAKSGSFHWTVTAINSNSTFVLANLTRKSLPSGQTDEIQLQPILDPGNWTIRAEVKPWHPLDHLFNNTFNLTFSISEPSSNTTNETNGTDTNGTDTNGTDTNGTDTNGTDTNGTDTNGTDTNGTDTNGTDTNGTDTNGTDTNGTDTNGTDTNGTDTNGTDTNGTDTNGTDTDGQSGGNSNSNEEESSDGEGSQSSDGEDNSLLPGFGVSSVFIAFLIGGTMASVIGRKNR